MALSHWPELITVCGWYKVLLDVNLHNPTTKMRPCNPPQGFVAMMEDILYYEIRATVAIFPKDAQILQIVSNVADTKLLLPHGQTFGGLQI